MANRPEVVEDGETFEPRPQKKAAEVPVTIKQWVLGERSGLVVPGLGGRPGVCSARYAGKQGDDAATRPDSCRAGASPDDSRAATTSARPPSRVRMVRFTRSSRAGATACHQRPARGNGGFGYDPLFMIPEYHKHSANSARASSTP